MSSPWGRTMDDSSGTSEKATTPQGTQEAQAVQTTVPFTFTPFSSAASQQQTTPQVPATTPTAVSSSTASPPAFTLSSQPFSFTTQVTPSANVTVSPTFLSSVVPATRGTKRSSVSRGRRDSDDDDDDDEDNNAGKDRDDDNEDEEELIHDEELDERPRKRAYPASAYYTGHEDLYEDEEGDEEYLPNSNTTVTQPRRAAVLSDDEQTEFKTNTASGEETFFDLLTHFAALHVPTSSTKLEPCPLCDVSFPLSDFADHVYQCIKKLDDIEKKEQERLDEKMARQLMDREVRMLDHHNPYYYHHHRRHHSHTHTYPHGLGNTPQYHPVRECPDGVNCTRTDEQHFLLVPHPDVNCPNCEQPVPLHGINNHLNICLTRKVGEKTSNAGNTMEDGDTITDKPTATTAAAQTPALSGPATTNTSMFDMTSAAFLAPRDRDTKQQRSRQDADDEEKNLPIRTDDDEEEEVAEDDDYDIDGLPRPTRGWSTNLDNPDTLRTNSTLAASTSLSAPTSAAASATTASSTSGSNTLKLTREQASAVASLVISRKEQFERYNAMHSSSSPTNDPSLAQLLDTFRSLGFTAENLSKLKEEEEQSKNKGSASSAAGAGTAAPQTSATLAPVSSTSSAATGPQLPVQP